jgi:hypothetical protein
MKIPLAIGNKHISGHFDVSPKTSFDFARSHKYNQHSDGRRYELQRDESSKALDGKKRHQ